MFWCTHNLQNCSKLFCGSRSWICRLCVYSHYSGEDDFGVSLSYDSFYSPLQLNSNSTEVYSDVL